MATWSDELFPLLLHSHHKIKTVWNTTSQVMDEVFNQLAGSTVPVVALVETLAEFASSHGRCIIFIELCSAGRLQSLELGNEWLEMSDFT